MILWCICAQTDSDTSCEAVFTSRKKALEYYEKINTGGYYEIGALYYMNYVVLNAELEKESD